MILCLNFLGAETVAMRHHAWYDMTLEGRLHWATRGKHWQGSVTGLGVGGPSLKEMRLVFLRVRRLQPSPQEHCLAGKPGGRSASYWGVP